MMTAIITPVSAVSTAVKQGYIVTIIQFTHGELNMTDRELALEQALIAVLAAAKEANINIADLVKNAHSIVLNSAHRCNIVDDKGIRLPPARRWIQLLARFK